MRDLDLYGRASAVQSTQAGKGEGQPAGSLKSPNASGASSPNPRLKLKQKACALEHSPASVISYACKDLRSRPQFVASGNLGACRYSGNTYMVPVWRQPPIHQDGRGAGWLLSSPGLACSLQAVASPDKASGMSPVEEHAVYSKSEQGWGAGSSAAGGTLLELDRTPDVHLDAAGPSNMAQLGSASSSEVGRPRQSVIPRGAERGGLS